MDVEVAVAGGRNSIFPPDRTLTRSGRLLATMIKARYLLSAINLNRARSIRLRYWRSQLLRSPILQTHIMMVQKPQGRKRVLVTVFPERIVAVYEDVDMCCLVRVLLKRSIVGRHNRNAQRCN